jgi:EAL domain-containing protein (putative c-di-GMP-specific phosphodiesterase class I)/DNA-binding response OmpR family regulator/GGDEF domain-containing protein
LRCFLITFKQNFYSHLSTSNRLGNIRVAHKDLAPLAAMHLYPIQNWCPNGNKRRILAVDDDAVTQLIIEDALADRFQVDTAASGEQALALFEQLHPDLVLLDVIMPGMTGFEVCTALRSHSLGQTLPVVMLTSQDDLASVAHAFEVGATDFIAKPINPALIPYRVSYLLRAHDTLQALALRECQLAAAQRIAKLGHWQFDPATEHFWLSEAARDLLQQRDQPEGHGREQLLASVHPCDRAQVEQCLRGLSTATGPGFQFEHRQQADPGMGERVLRQNAEYSQTAAVWLGTVQDVTDSHRSAQRIINLAYFDKGTDLPNRDFFIEYLQARLDRDDATSIRLLAVEVDALKRVGMGWGQAVTEPLLRDLSQRLLCELEIAPSPAWHRESPLSPQALSTRRPRLLARVGEASFAILITGDAEQGQLLARRLLATLSQPLEVAGIWLPIKANLGMADALSGDLHAETLLHHALAAATADSQIFGNVRLYHPDLDIGARSRLTLESRLRHAIDHGELELWYQPKVDGRSGALIGAEGLVRWRDPSAGLIAPGRFIPLAEDSGLIVPLTNRVLDLVCADLALMHAPGRRPVKISVNISAAQLDDERLPEEIAERLECAGLSPAHLELEITERALMARVDSVLGTLNKLRELGISLSLDDFGTGYSSLGYLGQFPLDILKIDRSFVMNLGRAKDAADTTAASETVARAIVALAKGLGLKVIAEGIETREQAAWLCDNGCDWHQGYFYARPLERDAFLRLLDPTASPSWSILPCPQKPAC